MLGVVASVKEVVDGQVMLLLIGYLTGSYNLCTLCLVEWWSLLGRNKILYRNQSVHVLQLAFDVFQKSLLELKLVLNSVGTNALLALLK